MPAARGSALPGCRHLRLVIRMPIALKKHVIVILSDYIVIFIISISYSRLHVGVVSDHCPVASHRRSADPPVS